MPHVHDKIDFTVETFVVFSDKVLLRKHDKYNIWLGVGGHVELDEDPNETALREVKEEVGLDVMLVDTRNFKEDTGDRKELIAPISLHRHKISDTHEHVAMFYVATSKTDKVIPEKEGAEWVWLSEEDLEKRNDIPANISFYAKRALEIVKNL